MTWLSKMPRLIKCEIYCARCRLEILCSTPHPWVSCCNDVACILWHNTQISQRNLLKRCDYFLKVNSCRWRHYLTHHLTIRVRSGGIRFWSAVRILQGSAWRVIQCELESSSLPLESSSLTAYCCWILRYWFPQCSLHHLDTAWTISMQNQESIHDAVTDGGGALISGNDWIMRVKCDNLTQFHSKSERSIPIHRFLRTCVTSGEWNTYSAPRLNLPARFSIFCFAIPLREEQR